MNPTRRVTMKTFSQKGERERLCGGREIQMRVEGWPVERSGGESLDEEPFCSSVSTDPKIHAPLN